MELDQKQRNAGLDVVRSIAILAVVIFHIDSIMADNSNKFLKIFGYFGVELFFVLSGFLIGQILIKKFIIDKTGSDTFKLTEFYLKRWFRTLPLYYLIFLINTFIFNPFQLVEKNQLWTYLFFLQTTLLEKVAFMQESWSLCVEEWFYLIFPLTILAAKSVSRTFSEKKFLILLLTLLIGSIILRGIFLFVKPVSWIFIPAFLRFDAIGFGVLLAYLLIFKKDIYTKLTNKYSFLAGIILLALIIACRWDYELLGSWQTTYIITPIITSISFIIMISFFESRKFAEIPFFTLTSKISYAMYLINIPFLALFPYKISNSLDNFYLLYILLFTISLIFIYLTSFILYKFYEKPMMELREGFFTKKLLNRLSKLS
ncbi:MAG TPA: acyltransferase [Candidatus Gastranaerophilales bacterium]|nr:acyltransferase [Candidatus Gastranaerophilales bacterium]